MESRMTITGNLTQDPQLRIGRNNGQPFAVLAVAVNHRRKDNESGAWVTTGTTFFDVLCWRETGANALLSFKKGDAVIVHGKFRLHEWASEKGMRATATIDADTVGPDLSFGTAPFSRGRGTYGLDPVDEYVPGEDGAEDEARLREYVDEDGVVSDEGAAALLGQPDQADQPAEAEGAVAA